MIYLFLYHISITDAASVIDDREVLMELYQATNGPQWVDNTNWGTSRPLSYWCGVAVDSNGRVTELSRSVNGLRGMYHIECNI